MQEFYREVDNNININRTFSIDDIHDEDRLHRFYIIGEDVTIDNILEDSEFLLENTNKVIEKLDTIIDTNTVVESENIQFEIVENQSEIHTDIVVNNDLSETKSE